jgi:hypothetical protein
MEYLRSIKITAYIIACLFVLILSGCATKPLYYWGNYEQVIYKHYAESSKSSPTQEIESLRKDEKEAHEKALPLPPGYHAYLGYLYYEVGNRELARNEFMMEKKNFPESSVLITRFLKK